MYILIAQKNTIKRIDLNRHHGVESIIKATVSAWMDAHIIKKTLQLHEGGENSVARKTKPATHLAQRQI